VAEVGDRADAGAVVVLRAAFEDGLEKFLVLFHRFSAGES
jgi:hypothetical protein